MIFAKSVLMFAAMIAMFSVALIGTDHLPASENNRDKTGTTWGCLKTLLSQPLFRTAVTTDVAKLAEKPGFMCFGERFAEALCVHPLAQVATDFVGKQRIRGMMRHTVTDTL